LRGLTTTFAEQPWRGFGHVDVRFWVHSGPATGSRR
jgi:hypothetical protein